jgi:hypothetical protein
MVDYSPVGSGSDQPLSGNNEVLTAPFLDRVLEIMLTYLLIDVAKQIAHPHRTVRASRATAQPLQKMVRKKAVTHIREFIRYLVGFAGGDDDPALSPRQRIVGDFG